MPPAMKIKFSSLLFCLCISVQGLRAQDVVTDGFSGRIKVLTEYNYKALGLTAFETKTGYKSTVKYDEQGRKLREFSYNPDGSVSSKSVFKTDEAGHVTEERNYDANGKYQYANLYKYGLRL
jgi:YD repeat-containing protein